MCYTGRAAAQSGCFCGEKWSVRNLLMFFFLFFSEGSGPQKDSCKIKVWKRPRVTVHYKAISHIYHEPLATFHQLNLIYKRTMSPSYWKWHFLARVVDLTTYNLQLKAQTFTFSQFKTEQANWISRLASVRLACFFFFLAYIFDSLYPVFRIESLKKKKKSHIIDKSCSRYAIWHGSSLSVKFWKGTLACNNLS